MESLNDRLRAIRDAGEAKRPPEVTAVMKGATEALRSTSILDGVPGVGALAHLQHGDAARERDHGEQEVLVGRRLFRDMEAAPQIAVAVDVDADDGEAEVVGDDRVARLVDRCRAQPGKVAHQFAVFVLL